MKTISALVIAFVLTTVNVYSQEISENWKGEAKRGEKVITFDQQF